MAAEGQRATKLWWEDSAAGPLDRARIDRYEARIAAYEARSETPVAPASRAERAWPRRPSRGRRVRVQTRRAAPDPAAGDKRRPVEPARAKPVRRRRRPSRARIALRRGVALVVLVFLAVNLISYASTMLAPSNVGLGVRSIEWLRDHGGAWLVNDIERIYYSLNAPSKGGPALKSLPKVGLQGAGVQSAYAPPPIRPVIAPALPREGIWRRTGPLVNGGPPILVTTFRPDPEYPRMVAGVAWIDSSRTSLQLYPGRYEPPEASYRGAMEVPPALRSQLVATFSSGFKLEDSGGGFAALGQVYAPLHAGMATLIGYRGGGVDVRTWAAGPRPGPSVLFARQNLPLIVQGGVLNPRIGEGSQWGATLGNAIRVWRSGVGVDVHGNLVFAAANDQTAQSLAEILQRAGAVRAMELDINSEWVTFNFYGGWGARFPAKLLPDMHREATRYLQPDDRDFFAVFARGSG